MRGIVLVCVLGVACGFDATSPAVSSGTSTGDASTGSGIGTTKSEESSTSTTGPMKETTSSGPPPTSTDTTTTSGAESSSTTVAVDDSAGSSSTTSVVAGCDRALWVTGETNVGENYDAPLYDRLVALDMEVTVVQSALSSAADVADNCVVILSALGSSTDIGAKFVDAPVGVVDLEPGLYDDMLYIDAIEDVWWDQGYDDVTIVDSAHSLAAGLSDTVSLWNGGGVVSWAIPVAGAEVVAIWPGEPTHVTLFGFESGATLAQGFVAPARRVGFPGGTSAIPMTDARIDLFEAAVLWAAGDLP